LSAIMCFYQIQDKTQYDRTQFAMTKNLFSMIHMVFTVFRLLTDFVCLYNYEF